MDCFQLVDDLIDDLTDKVNGVTTKDLFKMVEDNGYCSFGSPIDVAHQCADGMLFGAITSKCKACEGSLMYLSGWYYCYRNISKKCHGDHFSRDAVRKKRRWIISLEIANKFLVEDYVRKINFGSSLEISDVNEELFISPEDFKKIFEELKQNRGLTRIDFSILERLDDLRIGSGFTALLAIQEWNSLKNGMSSTDVDVEELKSDYLHAVHLLKESFFGVLGQIDIDKDVEQAVKLLRSLEEIVMASHLANLQYGVDLNNHVRFYDFLCKNKRSDEDKQYFKSACELFRIFLTDGEYSSFKEISRHCVDGEKLKFAQHGKLCFMHSLCERFSLEVKKKSESDMETRTIEGEGNSWHWFFEETAKIIYKGITPHIDVGNDFDKFVSAHSKNTSLKNQAVFKCYQEVCEKLIKDDFTSQQYNERKLETLIVWV
ncbi:hypothetical protein ACH5RR_023016 [Cinchona calisaya]|uniref:PARP1-like PADR1 domain-containing protein n=1 Tax=Cinchona calisaya TaxID=153742 RepID=A0ABD2ZAZ7_9GENT